MTIDAFLQPVEVPPADDSVQLDAPKVTGVADIAADERLHWYRSVTPLGMVFVSLWATEFPSPLVQMQDANGRLLDAACALGREALLLEQIEEWLGFALDLELAASPAEVYAQVLVTPRGRGLYRGEGSALLSVPLDLLTQVSPPSSEMEEACALHWGTLPCQLMLDRFVVPEKQLHQLEGGSLLLMPTSFEARWRCTAISELEPALHSVLFLQVNKICLEFFSSVEPQIAMGAGNEVEVRCNEPVAVPVDCLLGWSCVSSIPLPRPLARYSVLVVNNRGQIASGSLLPVGKGYAVYIETLEESAQWI